MVVYSFIFIFSNRFSQRLNESGTRKKILAIDVFGRIAVSLKAQTAMNIGDTVFVITRYPHTCGYAHRRCSPLILSANEAVREIETVISFQFRIQFTANLL